MAFTDMEKEEMKEIMNQVMKENMPEESADDKRARIMAIRNPIERQAAMEKNIALFRDRLH